MPGFICEECGTVDNTALGHYWARNFVKFKNSMLNNKALCIICKPQEYSDGSIDPNAGKWHDKFDQRHWSEYGTKETLIENCNTVHGLINAVEYFQKNQS